MKYDTWGTAVCNSLPISLSSSVQSNTFILFVLETSKVASVTFICQFKSILCIQSSFLATSPHISGILKFPLPVVCSKTEQTVTFGEKKNSFFYFKISVVKSEDKRQKRELVFPIHKLSCKG